MLWHHGAAVHRKRVNVRKRSKMLALANGSLIEMHTPRHWALTIKVPATGRAMLLICSLTGFCLVALNTTVV